MYSKGTVFGPLFFLNDLSDVVSRFNLVLNAYDKLLVTFIHIYPGNLILGQLFYVLNVEHQDKSSDILTDQSYLLEISSLYYHWIKVMIKI